MVGKLVRVPLPLPNIQKIVKNANDDLRRINIKIIIEFADMLMNGHSLEEILISRNTLIFLLQHLGFVVNWKVCVETSAGNSFGPENQFVTLDLSLNKMKIHKAFSECQN